MTTSALPSELTVYTGGLAVASWRDWVSERRQEPGEALVSLQGSAVEVIDGAGVQLLISLARSLRHQRSGLQVTEPSEVLAGACRRAGAAWLLGESGASA